MSQSSTVEPTASQRDGFSDWIDRELVQHSSSRKIISDVDLNHLLELRKLMTHHGEMDPARVIREFFRLRRFLEKHFYLLCYRLRNWLVIHYELEISDPLERVPPVTEPLDLRHRDFGNLLQSARHRFLENATVAVSMNDLRIRVVSRCVGK